jgi:Asp/Glu/hydantoin racemase
LPVQPAYAVAEMTAEHYTQFDAVIVAAFGDPGLLGLREALAIPLIGLTEAALASASLLGDRYSIVAISQRIHAWYRETVRFYGFEQRLARQGHSAHSRQLRSAQGWPHSRQCSDCGPLCALTCVWPRARAPVIVVPNDDAISRVICDAN